MTQAVQSTRPVARPARRGFQLNLHEGWIAGILLALMLISVTVSVASANWVEGLTQTMWAGLGGLVFGALVSRLRLNGAVALVLAVIVGAGFGSWLVSGYVGAQVDATWNEKMLLIQERVDQWLVHVLSGGLGTDTFVFLCVMTALGWFLGYTAAWSVFRHHQPWGAILPAGAALLANLFYAPPQSGLYMMVFLLSALLLLVRTTLLKRQQTWAAYAVRFANDIGLDFLVYGVIFSGLIILLAWLIPPTAPGPAWFGFVFDQVRQPWQDFQDDVSRAFSTVRGTNSAAPTTFFSSSLAMGGPIRLGSREVFQVESPYGRYWRAVVFDQYTGTGWVSSAQETAGFQPGDSRLKTMPMSKRRVVTQTVEVRLPTDNLVIAASQPERVNQAINAKFITARGGGDQSYLDLVSLRLQTPVQLGMEYTVVSSISAADENSLRAASIQIPSYIRAQYLELPGTVPERVKNLAVQITSNEKTTYDKARAIEQYLRTHITYNDQVDPIPEGFDGVDYVLFERPEGYCNYYASAMAVLARSVGIPARVASGYAVGSPSDDGLYHINEANAHSWPELYLGELGWVEFEPTSARPEIVRPVLRPNAEDTNDAEDRNADEPLGERGLGERRLEDLENQLNGGAASSPFGAITSAATNGWNIAFVILGLITAGVLTVVQLRWQKHLQKLTPGAQAAAEMYRFARFTGLPERGEATADERARELSALMPDSRDSIRDVNEVYVRERYGAHELSPEEGETARAGGVVVQKRMWRVVYERFVGSRIDAARASVAELPRSIERAAQEIQDRKSKF
jgi:transglutaminase-like putative cysteine protease